VDNRANATSVQGLGDRTAEDEHEDLLAPRRQERQVRKVNFFAAFAPLREIFRVLVAALPRWVSVVNTPSQ
jgi:hypothetical protein